MVKDEARSVARDAVADFKGRAQDTMADMQAKGREAQAAFSDIADTFGDAVDESIRTRPYATLAVVAGIGFLFGAAWSR